jgi:penicillin amidase/acyl-homoserine-lactone acylase
MNETYLDPDPIEPTRREKIMRVIRPVAAILALLMLVAIVIIYWPEREDLAYLASAGEPYTVRILRDEWGVPHVFGETDADAAYGLAYAHAEDDFLTIQQTLLAARGELATVFGQGAAPNDYMVHLLRIADVVEVEYPNLSPETRAISEAYAAGLNHYAALHEADALIGLFPVTGRDIIAGSIHKSPLFFGLDSTLAELFAETRQSEVSPRFPEPVAATASGNNHDLCSANPMNTGICFPGSNVIAVNENRSANGETFLAVNAHQPWTGPVAWYEAHVHSEEGWDMVGSLFPGMPVLAHGYNRDLGWGFTVNYADRTDVFVLEMNPNNPNQYRFDGEWRELESRPAPISVRLLGRLRITIEEEVLWSVYGPVVRQDHGTYAVRYVGMGRAGIFEQLYRMNKATNFAEWSAAMETLEMPTFNTGYADREGNIFYVYNGLIPIRDPHYDWQLYLPGNTSETLWTETLPFADLPQVLNPSSGFVVNTNHTPFAATLDPENPDPDDFSPTLGIETDLNNRAMRALTLFGEDPAVTEAEFKTYKYDMTYDPDSQLADFLRRVFALNLPTGDRYHDAREMLKNWDLTTTPENTGAALAILTYYALDYEEVENLTDEQIEIAFIETVDRMREEFGRVDVPWSEVNRLRRGEVDLGLGGGPDILHAVVGELSADMRLVGRQGDAYVLLVTWDAAGNVTARNIHQFGSATLDETSPHYADQAPLFVRRELRPVWMDEADIRAHLEREYRPGEE